MTGPTSAPSVSADKINVKKLAESKEVQCQYQEAVTESLRSLDKETSCQKTYEKIINTISTVASSAVGHEKKPQRRQPTDPEIVRLSKKQKELRLSWASTTNISKRADLKIQRNIIQHDIRRRCKESNERRLNSMAEEVERLKDGARMFKAVTVMTRKQAQKVVVEDSQGRIVGNAEESLNIIRTHFSTQFNRNSEKPIDPFEGKPRPLQRPITAAELKNVHRAPQQWQSTRPGWGECGVGEVWWRRISSQDRSLPQPHVRTP